MKEISNMLHLSVGILTAFNLLPASIFHFISPAGRQFPQNSWIIKLMLDLYACLTQLKQALKIEENICIKNKIEDKFFKFHFLYDNLLNYSSNIACSYDHV